MCSLFDMSRPRAALVTLLSAAALGALQWPKAVDSRIRSNSLVLFLLSCGLIATVVSGALNERLARHLLKYTSFSKATGIIDFRSRANDYLGELWSRVNAASSDVTFVGVNFYVTAPTGKEDLLAQVERGIRVRFLVFDVVDGNLEEVSNGFGQSPGSLVRQCMDTYEALDWLERQVADSAVRGDFEVRLFNSDPRTRLYIIDGNMESGVTFFVPHVDAKDSPNLPGFLAQNLELGIAAPYINSAGILWRRSMRWEDWRPKYEAWLEKPSTKALLSAADE